jgi:hypothetical protein
MSWWMWIYILIPALVHCLAKSFERYRADPW